MSEVDLIIHILSNLPEEYEVAVSELERKLKDDSIQLKMEDIRETLGSRYERIVKNDKPRKEKLHSRHSRSNSKVCVETVVNTDTRVMSVPSAKQEGTRRSSAGSVGTVGNKVILSGNARKGSLTRNKGNLKNSRCWLTRKSQVTSRTTCQKT